MASSEADYEDGCVVVEPVEAQWTPGRAVMVRAPAVDRTDWFRALLALFGRRAPVSAA